MELVSIIVPIYNVAQYLERCIQSIVSQSYSRLDIILVDDGSTDNSGHICEQWKKKDQRIVVIHKKNGGVSSARNAGLQYVKGELIAWIDPDDWVEPNFIMELYQALKRTETEIVVCGYCREGKGVFEKNEQYSSEIVLNTKNAIRELILEKKMPSFLWNKLFKTELFKNVEFPEGDTYEDLRVMHKLFLKTDKVAVIPDCLYHYDFRNASIVNDKTLVHWADYIKALMYRYQELNEEYPEETIEILKKIYIQVFGNLVLSGSKQERNRCRKKILEIRNFVFRKDNLKNICRKFTKKEKFYCIPGMLKMHIFLYEFLSSKGMKR